MENKIKHLKSELRNWERSFEEKHQRKPSKKEIDAIPEMSYKYKEYKKLKQGIVQQTKENETEIEQVQVGKRRSHIERTPSKRFKSFMNQTPDQNGKLKNVLEVEPTPNAPEQKFKLFEDSSTPAVKSEKAKLEKSRSFLIEMDLQTPGKMPFKSPNKTPFKSPKAKRPDSISKNTIPTGSPFFSPVARPRQGLLRSKSFLQESVVKKFLFSPSPKEVLKSKEIKEDETNEDKQGESIMENEAVYNFDSEVEKEEAVEKEETKKKHWKKKPILGKRQTSKRKLEPVFISNDMPDHRKSTAATKNQQAGVRLKLKKRGKRFTFSDHSAYFSIVYFSADRAIKVSDYTGAKELEMKKEDNPFGELEEFENEQSEEVVNKENGVVHFDSSFSYEQEDLSEQDLKEALFTYFGYSDFRPGQLECIQRILKRKTTVLVLPTGAGKSLCYQLPALLMTKKQPGVVLVISPLISLMQDQLQQLSKFNLKGCCLNSQMTNKEYYKHLEEIQEGNIKVLFISPEKLCSANFIKICKEKFPQILFACVDEVHCLAEWSHHFRPSYLSIGQYLDQLNVPCVLGMTGTLTLSAADSILNYLDIGIDSLLRPQLERDNLILSVSCDTDRKKAVAQLLTTEPFNNYHSIIIYCMRQNEADELATYLRIQSKEQCQSYHAGKQSKDRKKIQTDFLDGKLRIICATIAFGMGIHKTDIRAVIHYSLPKSIENYMQEIGRAGRDGKEARCHLFLNQMDFFKLRSLAFTDYIDQKSVLKLLGHFVNIKKDIVLPLLELEKELDLKKQNLITLISYIDSLLQEYVEVKQNIYHSYQLSFYHKSAEELSNGNNTFAQLQKFIKNNELNAQLAVEQGKLSYEEIDSCLQELMGQKKLVIQSKSGAFYIKLKKKITVDQLLPLVHLVFEKTNSVQMNLLNKIDLCFGMMKKVSIDSLKDLNANDSLFRNKELHQNIQAYFNLPNEKEEKEFLSLAKQTVDEMNANMESDVKQFIRQNREFNLTPKMIARIFHAIPSPAFPYELWSQNKFWGTGTKFEFLALLEMAKRLLAELL